MAMKLMQHWFHRGQTSQTNILIPKQGFTVHLDPRTTKTHNKQMAEKNKKIIFFSKEEIFFSSLVGFKKELLFPKSNPWAPLET